MNSLPVRARTLSHALALGPWALDATRDGHTYLFASVVHGPAIVLGQRQRAARVIAWDSLRDTPVYRRATTGTAAYIARTALVWTLALPHVAALLGDATPRTILNRNARVFLHGLNRVGALSQYFGREWIAVRHRPCALLGFDVTRDGRVLLEVIAGWEDSIALPERLCSPYERALDRWRGKLPVSLAESAGDTWSAEKVAHAVIAAAAERVHQNLATLDIEPDGELERVSRPDDPVPEGMECAEPVTVPVGYVETARGQGRTWFGGDALVSTAWLDDAARARDLGEPAPEALALEGARPEDWSRPETASP
jgi:hypothetical protein